MQQQVDPFIVGEAGEQQSVTSITIESRAVRPPTVEQKFSVRFPSDRSVPATNPCSTVVLPNGRPSLAIDRGCLEMLYSQLGSPRVQLVLWDGTVRGDCGLPVGRVILREPRVLRRIVTNPALGFGESYMLHELEVEGDLIATMAELNRSLTRVGCGTQWFSWRRWPWWQDSIKESRACVHHHYDLGNDFYQLWLDSQMVYTCAYYSHPQASLEEAQVSKLDYVCRKLRLKPGETVVEAGCGWGTLARHMVKNYGVTVRAFNLSREQMAYARQRATAEGLAGKIEFIEDDFRNITGKYDAFVSLGMLEHVGVENYRGFGKLLDRVLTLEGRGLIHNIGRNFKESLDPWTLKYIFPGAYVPTLREMMDLFEESRFSVLDVENLRLHYARTCNDWFDRFERVSEKVQQLFDERFVRMWRLYLASSSAAFRNGGLQLFQVVFARGANNNLTWTRQDWYR